VLEREARLADRDDPNPDLDLFHGFPDLSAMIEPDPGEHEAGPVGQQLRGSLAVALFTNGSSS
jgi:hypothetical protein